MHIASLMKKSFILISLALGLFMLMPIESSYAYRSWHTNKTWCGPNRCYVHHTYHWCNNGYCHYRWHTHWWFR